MSDAEKTPKVVSPTQSVEEAKALIDAAETFQRRKELADGLIASIDKGKERAGLPTTTPDELSRIQYKVYEHTLRDAGKNTEADAIRDWISAGRIRDVLRRELKSPNGMQPTIERIRAKSPDLLPLLIEDAPCKHDGTSHSHKRVHTTLRTLAQSPDIATEALETGYTNTIRETLSHYRAAKKGTKATSQPVEKKDSPEKPITPVPSNPVGGGTYPLSAGGHDNCGGCCDTGGSKNSGSSSTSGGGGVHYHGDTPCTKSHPHSHAPGGKCGHPHHEPHLPKGKPNAGLWVAGIAAAVGVGAYLINEYGKPEKKEIKPKSGDWKERAQQPTTSEARTL